MSTDPPPLNLSLLPSDIMRMVTRMEESSIDQMKLISPSWNAAVRDHLDDNGKKHPLERVYFHVEDDSSDEEDEDQWSDQLVYMHAILPKKCNPVRIGLEKWLRVHEEYSDAIEVTGEPLRVTFSTHDNDESDHEPEDACDQEEHEVVEDGYDNIPYQEESEELSQPPSHQGSENEDEEELDRDSHYVMDQSFPTPSLRLKRHGDSYEDASMDQKKVKKDIKDEPQAYSSGQALDDSPSPYVQLPINDQRRSRLNIEEEWRKIEKAKSEIEDQKKINEENRRKNEENSRKNEEERRKNEEDRRKIMEVKRKMECDRLKLLEDQSKFLAHARAVIDRRRMKTQDSLKLVPATRFFRFFNNFSIVESLILYGFIDHEMRAAKSMMASLGNLQVNRLELRNMDCYDETRELILAFARRHRISHIFMETNDHLRNLASFVSEIVKSKSTIDFFEELHLPEVPSATTKYFGKLPHFWQKMASELRNDGISMVIKTFADDANLSAKRIRTQISVMSIQQRESGLNCNNDYIRGFTK